MDVTLLTPRTTHLGVGCLAELPAQARRFGTTVALARGGESFTRAGLRTRLRQLLGDAGLTVIELPAQTREPEPADVDAAAAVAREAGAQMVVAVGGGSVIDLGKAVAALAPQTPVYPVCEYLEGVGTGRTLDADPLPLLAVPTTAGTGTEATKNAVIASTQGRFKKSLRDPRLLPAVALIDPELLRDLPPHLMAWSGMDALTQLIEAYTSNRAQPVTDALALRGLQATCRLPAACANGRDDSARAEMALAAYLSGVCLANAGLGAAHGIAAALGSVAPIGHGLACALALPWVMAANLPAAVAKYARVGEILCGRSAHDDEDGARAAVHAVWELSRTLGIPRAAELPVLAPVLAEAQLPALASACHGNSLRGNPRPLSDEELIALLRAMRDAENPFASP